eukprot:6054591-Alexandrium_andersonii.AAC.1
MRSDQTPQPPKRARHQRSGVRGPASPTPHWECPPPERQGGAGDARNCSMPGLLHRPKRCH